VKFWKANPHEFGPGRIHAISDDGLKLRCGRKLADVPGRYIDAPEYDCRACAAAIQRDKQRVIDEAHRNQQQAAWQAQRNAENRAWWQRYRAYLESPEWQQRRAAVMERAGGICEACGRELADEVHHTSYAHVFDEPLWELRAVCTDCHEKLTERDRENRNFGLPRG
jgi:hypothetical protein